MSELYSRYTDFLKERRFIRWQLMPDKALDEYWRNFIREHPHLRKEILQAAEYLKKTGLNKSPLSDAERDLLLRKIRKTIERNERKAKTRRFIRYSSAACAAIALFIGISLYFSRKGPLEKQPEKELIIGNLLNKEDIRLITGNKFLTFQNDIEVRIDEKGTAQIIEAQSQKSQRVEVSGTALNKLVVPYGKRTQLNLADGSKVWLNSGSVLEFPAQFTGDNREVRLASGEMYIEVAPENQKPFHVRTSDFNVKVYGTKFNISAYADSPQSVVLVEGRVSLQPVNKKETFLLPSEQAVYSDNGTFNTQKVDVSQYISWKNGYLTFDRTPMNEVLKQIGRYYNLSFNYDQDVNLQKRSCTGKIYLSENMDNVMTTVCLLSSTQYIKSDDRIFIINEPN